MATPPRHLDVARLMRAAIGSGVYPVGAHLPTPAQLAETYGVPEGVVRAALRELRSEGLVAGREPVEVVDTPGSGPASCVDG